MSITSKVFSTTSQSPVTQNDAAKYYYETFLLAILIVFFPSKILAYLAPFICFIWYLIRQRSGKGLKKLILFLLVYTLAVACYAIVGASQNMDFLISNTFVSLLTYSPFLFLLLVDGNFIRGEDHYDKYHRVIKYLILVQGLLGIFQFLVVKLTGRFDILPGDAVQGTIGLFAFVKEDAGFGNQMFAINMAFLIIFFTPFVLIHKKGYAVLLIGIVSLMLAGVMHVFLSLVAALLITIFFFRKNLIFSHLGKIVVVVSLAVISLFAFELFFPGITNTANVFYNIYKKQDSPKFLAIDRAVDELSEEYPQVYLIGLGPGQYTSRAGLMSSGEYFESHVPLFSNKITAPFKEYAYGIWKGYESNSARFGNSTMHRPFFSLLSIYMEFGLLFLIGIVLYIFKLFASLRRSYLSFRPENPLQAYLSFGIGLSLFFMLFFSFFDNYLETTQAIFPSLLLLYFFMNSSRIYRMTPEKKTPNT